MEHRQGQRNSCSVPVALYTRRDGVLYGRISNLSAGGAFIAISTQGSLPRGLLRLNFVSPGAAARECDWRALVVRECDAGIGVMFDRRHIQTAAALLRPQSARYPVVAMPPA